MKKPQKKPAARKRTAKKRSKIKTDAIKAFWLVCALVVVSILISFAIIFIYKGTGSREQLALSSEQLAVSSEQLEGSSEQGTINNEQLRMNNEQLGGKREEGRGKREQGIINNEQLTINNEQLANSNERVPQITNNNTRPQTPDPRPQTPDPRTPNPEPQISTTSSNTATTTNINPVIRSTEAGGVIAFVIDDAGNNLQELEPFLKINAPLTIAVLPGLPHSAEAARRIRAAGKDVILHQPMEAVGGQNPGPSAIYSNMSEDEVRSILKKNIEEVGPVVGMNNHQGSKITMDREIMEVILSFCNENNIYFLDSRTTAETAAPMAARRLGIKIAERNTFLDNEQDKESMMRYLSAGLTRAERNGQSIMIGHTWSPALAPLLAEQIPILTIQGYTIKTVSEMMR